MVVGETHKAEKEPHPVLALQSFTILYNLLQFDRKKNYIFVAVKIVIVYD
jgi:hypothetical protein